MVSRRAISWVGFNGIILDNQKEVHAFDGECNMKRDAELLALEVPAIRIYGWTEAWVTLGRYQNRDGLKPGLSVPTTVRPTGGRAVLHGHDLTVGMAVCYRDLGTQPRKLRETYRAMARPLIAGLQAAGIPAGLGEELAKAVRTRGSADCFLAASDNDIVNLATGAKVCGCALRMDRERALIQASIPIEIPWIDPGEVYELPAPVAPVQANRNQLASAIWEAFRLQFGVSALRLE